VVYETLFILPFYARILSPQLQSAQSQLTDPSSLLKLILPFILFLISKSPRRLSSPLTLLPLPLILFIFPSILLTFPLTVFVDPLTEFCYPFIIFVLPSTSFLLPDIILVFPLTDD
jgi:hypothetical protein